MNLITTGASRWVVLTQCRAYKFPRPTSWKLFLHGLLANLQEREFGRGYSTALCPVLWALPLGLMVVMPRAEWADADRVLELLSGQVINNLVIDVRSDIVVGVKDTAGNILPADVKLDNFGTLDGELVVIDYGS